jgi:putative ABC transport system permease protein
VLVSVGVALGVALMVTIRILNSAAAASLSTGLQSFGSNVDLAVADAVVGLPEDLATRLETIRGVQSALPVITGTVFTPTDGLPLTLLGLDLGHPAVEKAYAGIFLERELGPDGVHALSEANAALIPYELARARGGGIGSILRVDTPRGATDLKVVGLLKLGGFGRVVAESLVVTDLGVANGLLAKGGRVDRIDIVADGTEPRDQLIARLRDVVPSGATIGPAHEELGFRLQLAKAFLAITSGVSVFGLIVGFFLIYNVLSAAIIAEAPELARLRLQGATRRDLVGLLVMQAGWQALPGIAIGIGLGIIIARVAQLPFLQGLGSILQFRLPPDAGSVPYGGIALVAFLGLPAAMVASWLAVHRRVAASPLTVVTGSSAPAVSHAGAQSMQRASIALAIMASIFVTLELRGWRAEVWGMLAISVVSALLVTTAAALVLPAARMLRPILARLAGISGEIASDGLANAWSRTAVTTAVLALGIGTTSCITTIFHSAEGLVLDVLRHGFQGDLVITSAFRDRGWLESPLAIDVAHAIARLDGVQSVETERLVQVAYEGHNVTVRGVEASQQARGSRWIFVDGDPDAAADDMRGGDSVLVSRNFVAHFATRVGERIEIHGPVETRAFKVAGIVEDFVSPDGTIVLARAPFEAMWHDGLVNHIGIKLEPGRDIEGAIANIRKSLGDRYQVKIMRTDQFLAAARELIGQVFHFTRAVTAATLLIAVAALLQSIVSGALERRRVLSIIRAVGASRRHLRRAFILEGLSIALLGGGIGLAAGVLLSLLWIRVHLRCLLGWSLPIEWAWSSQIALGVLTLVSGTFAAFVAGRSLARVPKPRDLVSP